MAGPQDWGAAPVDLQAPGPEAWGAIPEAPAAAPTSAEMPEQIGSPVEAIKRHAAGLLASDQSPFLKYPQVGADVLAATALSIPDAVVALFRTGIKAASGEQPSLNEEISAGIMVAMGAGRMEVPRPVVEATAPIIKEFRDTVTEPAIQSLGQKAAFEVWHGSPHEFEAFDAGKIGTGEGSQSQGHGHYVAENPAVGEEYAKQLGGEEGYLYRVRVHANPEHFLDWDKSLDEQHPQVQQALESLGQRPGNQYLERTGQVAYRSLSTEHGGPEKASKALSEAGVPGIKYLDEGSRDTGEGTYNYVVFDDKDVQIIARNGSLLQTVAKAREFGMLEPPPSPAEQAAREQASPAAQAQRDIPGPQTLSAARTPAELLTPMGEPIDAFQARTKAWIDKIEAPEDVRAAIEDIAANNDFYPQARAGEMPLAHVEKVAEAAGLDPSKVDRGGLNARFDNDAKIRAVEHTLIQTARDWREAADKADADPSPENNAAALAAEIKQSYVLEYVFGLRAEWGRSGQALQLILKRVDRDKAVRVITQGETEGAIPPGVGGLVDATNQMRDNLANPPKKGGVGLDKLIKAAQRLAEAQMKPTAEGVVPPIPEEFQGLIGEARDVMQRLQRGDRTTPLDAIVKAAEKQVENALKDTSRARTPIEAVPDELKALVDKADRVVKRFGGVTPEEAVAKTLTDKGRSPTDLRTLLRSARGATDGEAASLLASTRGKPPGWFFWLWRQWLLSGIVTHLGYAGINTGYTVTERVGAPLLAATINKIKGGEGTFFGEPMMAGLGLIHSVPEGLKAAFEAARTGQRVPLESEFRLVERGETSPESRAVPYGQQLGPDWGMWKSAADWMGVPMSVRNAAEITAGGWSGRMANMLHTFFKVLNEGADAKALAYRAAANEGLDPIADGGQFWDRYRYHVAYPTDDALAHSVRAAYSGSFMEKLGSKTGNIAQAIRNSPMHWIFPFMHVPLNIARAAVRYSPLASLGPEMRANLFGENGGEAQGLAIAKVAIGSSLIGYFAMSALKGTATGDYPIDPNERHDWQSLGIQPNSVQIGGEWVSTQRWGPARGLANLGANLGHLIAHYDGSDDAAMAKAAGGALVAAVHFLGDEVGFTFLHNLVEAMENPKRLPSIMASQATSFLPYSTQLGQMAAIGDPYMREADSFIAGVKYRIPGLRETLPPRRDPLYGEPVPNPAYATLQRAAPINQDPIKAELARIGYHPTPPENNIVKQKLSPELFDEYQATAGPLVKALLQRNMPAMQENVPDGYKLAIVRKLVDMGRHEARTAVLAHHPEIISQGVEARERAILGPSPSRQ